MEKPKVSVIIPCYNAENTIRSTIDSLKGQTYKDFEVVFVNDGSTDNTLNVIEDHMMDSGIRYTIITQQNGGVSLARNTGIGISKGEYIMFLDGDDIYHWRMIEYLVGQMESMKTDTAFCSYSRNIDDLLNVKYHNVSGVTLLDNYKLQEYFLFNYIPCGMPMFIYKKQVIDKFKIQFTPNTKYGEDREFAWKYLCHCNSGAAIDMELYGYYNNPKSAVNNVSIDKMDLLTAIYRVDEYLEKNSSSFYPVFHKLASSRTLWAILKTFSKANRKDLFKTCISRKEAKKHMIRLLRYPDSRIKITALLYIISPSLFFLFIKKFYQIGGSK